MTETDRAFLIEIITALRRARVALERIEEREIGEDYVRALRAQKSSSKRPVLRVVKGGVDA